ncbi:MAG: carboxypeptidase regulatory-like domain-containing protein, partial [Bryobacterales bacterium]|nr:carboxypeptidase regulatory-like domain-containing protein [Bryobacterales bacterium]
MRTKIVRLLSLFSACSIIWAQAISTSQIKGTVQDASGAAVPDAQVKVTQTGTGINRTTTTGADGSYVFTELPIGPYQLEVTKQGFNRYLQTGITLQVNSNPTIDVALKVGAVTEQVVVEASAAMVETENAGVGQVIDQQRVVDLPLNGRQVTDLLYLTGGTSEGRAFRGSYPTQTSPSIAGGMAGSVSYWLDGGTHNDPLSNQNLPLPFPDALQEFKVETSSLPAQYGVHPAGAVNAVTKSGSNQFHGDLFEFVRNYIFDARTTGYANATNPRDNLKRNQFGGTIGG